MAIKSVNLAKLNKKLKDNLFSEIHILKELQHPHIVSLFDCRESTTHIHLVMEYCQLGDLSYFIKRRDVLANNSYTADMVKKYPNPAAGGLHEVVVHHFLQQLASALEFLRNKNLIHRDVKPQNLLIIPSPLSYTKNRAPPISYAPSDKSLVPVAGIESLPMLKLADFGFARSLPSTSLAETLCGSPLYMAPEILRYEKYDAKADLWSVGTVMYEMITGRPPFRASNHVELLRKIERGEDKIRIPDDPVVSESMKSLIKGLLKRNPVERMGFGDFFDNTVIKEEIPGLVGEDRPRKALAQEPAEATSEPMVRQSSGSRETPTMSGSPRTKRETTAQRPGIARAPASEGEAIISRRPPGQKSNPQRQAISEEVETKEVYADAPERQAQARRPDYKTRATAPVTQAALRDPAVNPTATGSNRRPSRGSASSGSSLPPDDNQARLFQKRRSEEMRLEREAKERMALDAKIDGEYVHVEKKAVEVNALADQLAQAASPAANLGYQNTKNAREGGMARRVTTQATTTTGANVTTSRAISIATGKRPDHNRQTSTDKRLSSGKSASSAISKAIDAATGRLRTFSFSPSQGFMRGGVSPPLYAPFPAYPPTHGSLLMIGDAPKTSSPLDEDTKAVHIIEESATRSDVVYGFAEVKYKQLMPLTPSTDHGLGLREAGIPEKPPSSSTNEDESGLTVDAIVTLSEEALVLYVKALALLARSMDIAGAWWQRKSRGEIIEESTSPRSQPSAAHNIAVGNRVNNVVQWVRNRFNEVLEKAEISRLKLIEAQKRLPLDHPSHPQNHPSTSSTSTTTTGGMGTSAENVVVTSGVTAEKLMYLRALEMSRSAAVNELVCEDLPGCEIAYVTAVRMLEAVLESEEESGVKKIAAALGKEPLAGRLEKEEFSLVNPEDRDSVLKRMFLLSWSNLSFFPLGRLWADFSTLVVQGIRGRLAVLRKKLAIVAKRNSTGGTVTAATPLPPPNKQIVPATANPMPPVAGTPLS